MAGLRFTDYFSLGDEFQENPMVKAGVAAGDGNLWGWKLDVGWMPRSKWAATQRKHDFLWRRRCSCCELKGVVSWKILERSKDITITHIISHLQWTKGFSWFLEVGPAISVLQRFVFVVFFWELVPGQWYHGPGTWSWIWNGASADLQGVFWRWHTGT